MECNAIRRFRSSLPIVQHSTNRWSFMISSLDISNQSEVIYSDEKVLEAAQAQARSDSEVTIRIRRCCVSLIQQQPSSWPRLAWLQHSGRGVTLGPEWEHWVVWSELELQTKHRRSFHNRITEEVLALVGSFSVITILCVDLRLNCEAEVMKL